MPAQVVVVLDDLDFANQTVEELAARKYEAIALPNPLTALEALGRAARVELLITSAAHAEGQPHGVSLALMARSKRQNVKVVFIGAPEQARRTVGIGAFLMTPITVGTVVETAVRLLTSRTVP
jgi:PleD family two-component response regulator